MDVDAIMDKAILAARKTFGRPVTYVPPDGGASKAFVADFQRASKNVDLDAVEHSTFDPRLDVRQADLDALGLVVEQQGVVSFTAEGKLQSYVVLDVQRSAVGTTVLVLGRRAA